MKPIHGCAVLVCVLASTGVGCGGMPTTPVPTVVPPAGQAVSPAPVPSAKAEVSVIDAEMLEQLLASAKGKTVVVNVWATFCIPCVEEMPELAQFYRERDRQRIEFISLNADPEYSIEDTVKPFVSERKVPFPVHVLPLGDLPPDRVNKILGVGESGWAGELPATFVLDASGAMTTYWLERVHLEDLTAAVVEDAKP